MYPTVLTRLKKLKPSSGRRLINDASKQRRRVRTSKAKWWQSMFNRRAYLSIRANSELKEQERRKTFVLRFTFQRSA
jgi:hypothetical protein